MVQAKLLLLFRRTIPWRRSIFDKFAVHSALWERHYNQTPPGANFSTWIRSAHYRQAAFDRQVFKEDMICRIFANLALSRLRETEGEGVALDGADGGAALGKALLAHPRVVWVGVTDLWAESMLTLGPVLGLPAYEAFDFGINVVTRKTKSKGSSAGNETSAGPPTLLEDDRAFLSRLEAREIAYVDAFEAHLASGVSGLFCGEFCRIENPGEAACGLWASEGECRDGEGGRGAGGSAGWMRERCRTACPAQSSGSAPRRHHSRAGGIR